MRYSAETRARALKLLKGGMSKVRVAALLGVQADTLRHWQKRPPKQERQLPVRLRVERGALCDRLVLARGIVVLEVFGVRRAGGWVLAPAGATHAKALWAVLPVLVAAAQSATSAFAESPVVLPTRPTSRMPTT